jgi:hypothetical protein
MKIAGWVWYFLLVVAGVAVFLRLITLSKEVKKAGQNYRQAAAERAREENMHRAGGPAVVYAVVADERSSLSPVPVVPSNPNDVDITRALPFALRDDENTSILVADIKNKHTRYLLINGKFYLAKHGGWAPRSDPDIEDNMYAFAWLLDPEDNVSFPLGEPGSISEGIALVGDDNGDARCYVMGF